MPAEKPQESNSERVVTEPFEKTEEPSGNIATAVDGIPRPLERLPYWRVVFIVPKTHCEVDSRSNVN